MGRTVTTEELFGTKKNILSTEELFGQTEPKIVSTEELFGQSLMEDLPKDYQPKYRYSDELTDPYTGQPSGRTLTQEAEELEALSPERQERERQGLETALRPAVTEPLPPEPKKFTQRVKASWEQGVHNVSIGELRAQQLFEGVDTESEIQRLKKERPQYERKRRSLPEEAVRAAAEMAPLMFESLKQATQKGLITAGGFAGITAVAGQAGPQIATPEELITVPAAAVMGYSVGAVYGASNYIMRAEAGLAYDEMLESKIDPDIARPIAMGVGAVNAVLELAQINTLLKTIPGGKKLLLGNLMKETSKKIAKSPTIKRLLLRAGVKYGGVIATETVQELSQEISSITGAELGKYINNSLRGTKLPFSTKQQIADRLIETAKQSALAFSVMALPGQVVTTGKEVIGEQIQKSGQALGEDIQAIIESEAGFARIRKEPVSLEAEAKPIEAIPKLESLVKEARKAKNMGAFTDKLIWGKLRTKENIKIMQKNFDYGFMQETPRAGTRGVLEIAQDFYKQATSKPAFTEAIKPPVKPEVKGVEPAKIAGEVETALHKGAKVRLPDTSNAVHVINEKGQVANILKKDFDVLKEAGPYTQAIPLNVKFDTKGRPDWKTAKILELPTKADMTAVEYAKEIKRLEKVIRSTERVFAKPIAPTKVAKVVKEVTGVKKPVVKITIPENLLFKQQLKKEAKGAKIGFKAGRRDVIRKRIAFLRGVQERFELTDKDLKKIIHNRNVGIMSDKDFKIFIDKVRGEAVKVSERRQKMNELQAHIKEKELDVSNLRKSMKLPTFKNMTTDHIIRLDEALKPYQKGDVFLGVRKLETVDRTELKGVKTWREVRERLAKKLNVPIENLQNIKVSELDRFRFDTALAERNDFYKMMVEETSARMMTSEAEYLKIEDEIFNIARKLRPKGFVKKLMNLFIPQQKIIRRFMEAPIEAKEAIAEQMTPAELDLADYMVKKFSEAREYLLEIEAMNMGKENYFVHIRRGILEAVKEDGWIQAAKEIFISHKMEEQNFNILDRNTGEILALDKFFKFAMHRTGKLIPTENTVKAFLQYMKTFKKKQALDEIVPLIDIYAHSLTPKGMTKEGLFLHGNLIKFVKEFLNTKKGRHITLIAKQGGKIDRAVRAGIMFTALRDLGFNLPVSIATEVGEQVTTYQLLGKVNYLKGKLRQNTKQGKKIVEKHRSFIGKNPWKELIEPARNIGERLSEGIFVLFSDASVRANKTFVLGSLTKQEFRSGVITPERLASLRTELGRYRMVEGSKSIFGATPEGGQYTQYKRWAIPILRTTIKNLENLSIRLLSKKTGFKAKKKSALELYRIVELTAFVLAIRGLIGDDDDKGFIAKLKSKVYRESMTLVQALNLRMYGGPGRLANFIQDFLENIYLLVTLEEYSPKGKLAGKLKGVRKLKKQFKPVAVSQFEKEKKKETTGYKRKFKKQTRETTGYKRKFKKD